MFRIITANLNGIRAAARKGFFRWMIDQRPDIVCLQETKAQEHQLPPEALDTPEFHTASSMRKKKGYSGVAIYARRAPERIVRGLNIEEYDIEGRFVRMDFAGGLSVASLYVPSGTSGPQGKRLRRHFSIASSRCSSR